MGYCKARKSSSYKWTPNPKPQTPNYGTSLCAGRIVYSASL